MSDSNKEIFIDQKAVDAADARIRESKSLAGRVMSSWGNPMDGVESGPMGKITPPKPPEMMPAMSVTRNISIGSTTRIPSQAMGIFKKILPFWEELEVKLSTDQKRMFLESIQSMPTPKKMSDAKEIFELMEALSK